MSVALWRRFVACAVIAMIFALLAGAGPAQAQMSAGEYRQAEKLRSQPFVAQHKRTRAHSRRTRHAPVSRVAQASPASPASHGAIGAMVTRAALDHGVPPRVAHAIVKVESNYNCAAKNPHSTATGVMQTLRATAHGEGVFGDLRNCAVSLRAGMAYLAKIVRAHGVTCAALSLYERGLYARPRCTAYGARAARLART